MTSVECDSNVIVFIYRNVSSSTNGFLALLGMTKGVCDSNVTVFIIRNISSSACGFLALLGMTNGDCDLGAIAQNLLSTEFPSAKHFTDN